MAIARASDVEYIGANMSGGMVVGLAATDKVGFFAATPIVSINAALVALGLIVTT